MDEMDIFGGVAASEPIGEDGLKRSSETLLRIVPKDGKSSSYSGDQARAGTLTITQQGGSALAAMPGQPLSLTLLAVICHPSPCHTSRTSCPPCTLLTCTVRR